MSRFSKIKLATLVCAICLGFVVKKLDHYSAGDRIRSLDRAQRTECVAGTGLVHVIRPKVGCLLPMGTKAG